MTWKLARLETDALLRALRAVEPPTSEERARVWNAIQKALSEEARRAMNDTDRGVERTFGRLRQPS